MLLHMLLIKVGVELINILKEPLTNHQLIPCWLAAQSTICRSLNNISHWEDTFSNIFI